MTDTTPHLGLPLIAASQAQKHVTHNEALGLLDALVQLACLDKDLAAPPQSPADGDRYLVAAANPGGAWAGLAGQVVRYADGVWTGAAPRAGWLAYLIDEADLYVFDGAAWTSLRRSLAALQSVDRLGINTAADATNRLAVKADAALLTWDDATPGTGDMRVSVNKKAAAREAGLVFETGNAARALLGTLGSDDFSLKVSPDGATFATALTASAATGGIDFASAETALAAAATTDLGAAATRRVLVTGTATITSFGTRPNRERLIRFAGASTLIHDAAALSLPGGADIATAFGDTAVAVSDASGRWRVLSYAVAAAQGPAVPFGGGVAAAGGQLASAAQAGRYLRIAPKLVWFDLTVTIADNGTGAGAILVALPVMPASAAIVTGRENAVTGKQLQGYIAPGATNMAILNYDNTYPGGTNYSLILSGVYETA